jgi:hypothetical protein
MWPILERAVRAGVSSQPSRVAGEHVGTATRGAGMRRGASGRDPAVTGARM